jgi:hypothetical protein
VAPKTAHSAGYCLLPRITFSRFEPLTANTIEASSATATTTRDGWVKRLSGQRRKPLSPVTLVVGARSQCHYDNLSSYLVVSTLTPAAA